MNSTLTSVNLKCLNCGANLRIGSSVVEFACEYCGASQIVDRDGGVVALRLLSEKVDRIQDTVDRTAAELAIQGLTDELDDLETNFNRLEESTSAQGDLLRQGFFMLFGLICIISIGVGTFSSVFGIAVAIAGFIWLAVLRKGRISRLDSDFEKQSKPLIDKGVAIKKSIIEYEKIVNS
jgi:predicted RNA-binding Zn-ribbon protein involved in translation (DUF1610 family)